MQYYYYVCNLLANILSLSAVDWYQIWLQLKT